MHLEAKIAVIIPIHNSSYFLRDCLNSLQSQTYSDWSAICVDDMSEDTSLDILKEYATTDHRIHIIQNATNMGAAKSRNIAIQYVLNTGFHHWICFLDSDDYIAPTYLELIANAIKDKKGCDFVRLFSQRTNLRPDSAFFKNKELVAPISLTNIERFVWLSKTIGGGKTLIYSTLTIDDYFNAGIVGGQVSSCCVHTSLVKRVEQWFPDDVNVLEDQIFNIRCALHSKNILVIPNQSYYYYSNPASVTGRNVSRSEDIIACVNRLYPLICGHSKCTRNWAENNWLPIKMEMLIGDMFRYKRDFGLLKSLDPNIHYHKYIKDVRSKIKFTLLWFSKISKSKCRSGDKPQ